MEAVKVIVAEDERLIRQGIISSINWEGMGAAVAGQAKNGVQALKLIREEEPHILITDIKMGGGDGLTLIREAKILNPDLHIVIISGFNNFDYAQRAIQLGVTDYLLKPVVIGDLEKVLQKIMDRIRIEDSEKRDKEEQDLKYSRNRQILIDQFFREMIYGVIDADEIDRKAEDYGLEIIRASYCCLNLFLELGDGLRWDESKDLLRSMLEEFCTHRHLYIESILLAPDQLHHTDITILFSSDVDTIPRESMLKELTRLFAESRKMTALALGLGPDVNALKSLGISYQGGRTQAYFSLISGMESGERERENEIPVNIYETTRELYEIFSKADQRKMNSYLKDIEKITEDESIPLEKRTGIARNHLVCILSAGDELGIAVKEFFPDLMVLFRYINLKSLKEMVEKFRWACETILSQLQTREAKTSINLMDKAKSIISKNYTDPLLSLESIAEQLAITPAYFSKLYKQYHGSSYIEYLTSLRLGRAKELLSGDSTLKISAVAFMVGYNSSSYFNYIFKKSFGITPREFQKQL